MKVLGMERAALGITIVGILAVFTLPFLYESWVSRSGENADLRVITLTAIAETGIWTTEEVRGGNYFAKGFVPARPELKVGESVLLRLKSADVIHDFYCPELGIGPLEVYPGLVEEVVVTPVAPGAYDFYCTTVCGQAHFRMRGQFVVRPAISTFEDPGEYWLAELPDNASLVERGEWLFKRHACFSCHGEAGHGGISNANYVKGTVPALDSMASEASLYYPEDIEAIVSALGQETPLEDLWDDPPVPLFHVVLPKYQAVRELIRGGVPPGKLDQEGPVPPLVMPAWGQVLSDSDIDALIDYLLTLEPKEHVAGVGG
jgi:mono/diheme cytochrome c family protein